MRDGPEAELLTALERLIIVSESSRSVSSALCDDVLQKVNNLRNDVGSSQHKLVIALQSVSIQGLVMDLQEPGIGPEAEHRCIESMRSCHDLLEKAVPGYERLSGYTPRGFIDNRLFHAIRQEWGPEEER